MKRLLLEVAACSTFLVSEMSPKCNRRGDIITNGAYPLDPDQDKHTVRTFNSKTIAELFDVNRTVKAVKGDRNQPLSNCGWETTRGQMKGSNGYKFIDFAEDDCLQ